MKLKKENGNSIFLEFLIVEKFEQNHSIHMEFANHNGIKKQSRKRNFIWK